MATTQQPALVKSTRGTRSTIALKITMAVSGLLFIAFVLVHMYGNLKAFQGAEAFNNYAEHLRTLGTPILPYSGFLWITRVVLLGALIVHVTSAVTLWRRANRARPVAYVNRHYKKSALSSRTMRWGGLTILLFLIWHLLNFSIVRINPQGGVGGFTGSDQHPDPYRLLVDSFQSPWNTAVYLVAMLALGMHLHHGTWSSMQTLGFTNSAASRARAKTAGWVVAIVIAGGFSLVPIFTIARVIN